MQLLTDRGLDPEKHAVVKSLLSDLESELRKTCRRYWFHEQGQKGWYSGEADSIRALGEAIDKFATTHFKHLLPYKPSRIAAEEAKMPPLPAAASASLPKKSTDGGRNKKKKKKTKLRFSRRHDDLPDDVTEDPDYTTESDSD